MAWYVVYRGREPRVYATWSKCHNQLTGFPNYCYKSFRTKEEAVAAYMEFKGCEDEKVVVKDPAPTSVVNKTPGLLVLCIVQSSVLVVLLLFIVSGGKKCL